MSMETSGVKFGVYTVQQGDNLTKIIEKSGGEANVSTFEEIAQQNNIQDINKIYVDQEIYLDANCLENQILNYINDLSGADAEISDLSNLNFLNTDESYNLAELTEGLKELAREYGNNENFSEELEVVNGVLEQIKIKGDADIKEKQYNEVKEQYGDSDEATIEARRELDDANIKKHQQNNEINFTTAKDDYKNSYNKKNQAQNNYNEAIEEYGEGYAPNAQNELSKANKDFKNSQKEFEAALLNTDTKAQLEKAQNNYNEAIEEYGEGYAPNAQNELSKAKALNNYKQALVNYNEAVEEYGEGYASNAQNELNKAREIYLKYQ